MLRGHAIDRRASTQREFWWGFLWGDDRVVHDGDIKDRRTTWSQSGLSITTLQQVHQNYSFLRACFAKPNYVYGPNLVPVLGLQ
ncbi:hypothetical protein FHL15_000486 [Xylaria flabelliformis]|uniref:Uncharacterized protein n=1 Tax=Xylaria flabelliformis TaxID=2512241 RepID=A0A553IDY5_9PEZI|nr:hypothetical protein FHL15_000486 [Xylaria flabelliformis]